MLTQVDVGDGKTAVCIFVPVPQLGLVQKLIKEVRLWKDAWEGGLWH